MKLKEEKIYKSKTKYIPVYINESLYKELFGSYDFKEASDKLSEMFSITTSQNENFIGFGYSDYQFCPLNISLSGNLGSGRAFFYNKFNIKGDKTSLATSKNIEYSNGCYALAAGLKEAVISETLFNISPVKPFRTLCVLAMGENFLSGVKTLDENGNVVTTKQTFERCLEIRFAYDNELNRISNALFDKESINPDIYKKLADFEAFKFINKFLHGSWSFGNVSIDGNPIDFDTSTFLSEFMPVFTNTNKYKDNFFGFEYLGAGKILENITNIDFKLFKEEYNNRCIYYFSHLLGLDETFINDDLIKLFDKFVFLSSKTLINSVDMNAFTDNACLLHYYNFSSFFGNILFDFNKITALRLFLNNCYASKDDSAFFENVNNFFKSDIDILEEAIDFIDLYFSFFENIKITDEIRLKAFKMNLSKNSLCESSNIIEFIYDKYENGNFNPEFINYILNLIIENGKGNIQNLYLFDDFLLYTKINGLKYNVYIEPINLVDFAKIKTDKNEFLVKKYCKNQKIILISEDININEKIKNIVINNKLIWEE